MLMEILGKINILLDHPQAFLLDPSVMLSFQILEGLEVVLT